MGLPDIPRSQQTGCRVEVFCPARRRRAAQLCCLWPFGIRLLPPGVSYLSAISDIPSVADKAILHPEFGLKQEVVRVAGTAAIVAGRDLVRRVAQHGTSERPHASRHDHRGASCGCDPKHLRNDHAWETRSALTSNC